MFLFSDVVFLRCHVLSSIPKQGVNRRVWVAEKAYGQSVVGAFFAEVGFPGAVGTHSGLSFGIWCVHVVSISNLPSQLLVRGEFVLQDAYHGVHILL